MSYFYVPVSLLLDITFDQCVSPHSPRQMIIRYIVLAFQSGRYTTGAIADGIGLHYSSVSKIIQATKINDLRPYPICSGSEISI
jgi:hypothetical protein